MLAAMWDPLIDAAGGNLAVAKALGINAKAVSQWRKRGIPARFWLDMARMAKVDLEQVKRPLWRREGGVHDPHNVEIVASEPNRFFASDSTNGVGA